MRDSIAALGQRERVLRERDGLPSKAPATSDNARASESSTRDRAA
jgi:hypothetical protein